MTLVGETGTWRGLTAREQAILLAWKHWIGKDHEYRTDCYGCLDGAAWLAVPGYKGELAHPMVH
jgi:hypothetical protein